MAYSTSISGNIPQRKMSDTISYSSYNSVSGLSVPHQCNILPSGNSIIQCTILATLDNVMGPKAVCIWKQNTRDLQSLDASKHAGTSETEALSSIVTEEHCAINYDDAIRYIAIHTLQGELSKGVTNSKNFRTEMFIVPHKNVVANAIVFSVDIPNKKDSIGHSLSIVCKADVWSYFLKIQYLCDVWQQRMAAKIQVLLSMVCIDANYNIHFLFMQFLKDVPNSK